MIGGVSPSVFSTSTLVDDRNESVGSSFGGVVVRSKSESFSSLNINVPIDGGDGVSPRGCILITIGTFTAGRADEDVTFVGSYSSFSFERFVVELESTSAGSIAC